MAMSDAIKNQTLRLNIGYSTINYLINQLQSYPHSSFPLSSPVGWNFPRLSNEDILQKELHPNILSIREELYRVKNNLSKKSKLLRDKHFTFRMTPEIECKYIAYRIAYRLSEIVSGETLDCLPYTAEYFKKLEGSNDGSLYDFLNGPVKLWPLKPAGGRNIMCHTEKGSNSKLTKHISKQIDKAIETGFITEVVSEALDSINECAR